MATLKVTVSIPDPDTFEAVVARAKAEGFKLEAAFPPLGIATGSIAVQNVSALRSLNGVGSVEEERSYKPA